MSCTSLRALALVLATASLLAGRPAAAQTAERFDLSGEGRTGSLTLTPCQGGVDAVVELTGEDGGRTIRGRLRRAGDDSLQGRLKGSAGLIGGLAPQTSVAPAYEVRFERGDLVSSLRLDRGVLRTPRGLRPIEGVPRETITLRASAPLGARHAANEAAITRFYEAFARGDAAGMAAEYAPDVHFSDPVFPDLRGAEAGGMWAMLCQSQPRIEFSGVRADAHHGVARWDAYYQLIPGHPVHNVIEARFELRDGKIVRHVDSFDFARWAAQALGPARFLPTRFLLRAVRRLSASQLKRFMREREAE